MALVSPTTNIKYDKKKSEKDMVEMTNLATVYNAGTHSDNNINYGFGDIDEITPLVSVQTTSSCKNCLSQTYILTKKNVITQLRFRVATSAQLCVGVFCLIVLALSSLGINALLNSYPSLMPNQAPGEVKLTNILCDPKYNQVKAKVLDNGLEVMEKQRCYTFAIIGNNSAHGYDLQLGNTIAKIGDIPGQNNDQGGWQFFHGGYQDFKAFILKNPNITRLAVEMDWSKLKAKEISYTIHHNHTYQCSGHEAEFGCDFMPIKDGVVGLQALVDSALIRILNPTYQKTARIFPTFKDMPKTIKVIRYDVEAVIGPFLLPFTLYFLFAVQVHLIAIEKERQLPDQLRIMGMKQVSFYSSWLINHIIVNLIFVLLFLICGMIVGINVFKKNDFSVLFLTFFLSSMSFTGMSFTFSALFRNAKDALTFVTGAIMLYYVVGSIAATFFFTAGTVRNDLRALISWIPMISPGVHSVLLIQLLFTKASLMEDGIQYGEIYHNIAPIKYDDQGKLTNDFWSIASSFEVLFAHFFLHVFLGWYLEKVLPNIYGKQEKYLFCLFPSYWCGRKRSNADYDNARQNDIKYFDTMSPAVKEEADRIKNKIYTVDEHIAVEVIGLKKDFNTAAGYVTAVDGIAYSIGQNQLFALLGHNGAGKTTTINMLAGNMSVSAGDAKIFGKSLVNDFDLIAEEMGICPQHNILWDHLTGREHLELFSRIKGVMPEKVEFEVNGRLDEVNLNYAADVAAGAYSGGMKRRLSIAIALIGNPKVVYLDEPTTGMDPVTRRDVWNTIERVKANRVVVLTTHSMEEADVLGDRIAVMSHGHIQAIGTSLELKERYGRGMLITIIINKGAKVNRIVHFMHERIKGTLDKDVGEALFFCLPRTFDDLAKDETKEQRLAAFFELLEKEQENLGIKTFSIGMPTLEEVFVELARLDDLVEKKVEFTIPPGGAIAGTKLTFTLPDGSRYPYITPDGMKEGDTVITDCKISADKISKFQAKKANQNLHHNLYEKNSFAGAKALCTKARDLDRRSWGVCLLQLLLPLFVMYLIFVFDTFLYGLRVESMCGTGIVTVEECIDEKRGYEMDCILETAERTYPQTFGFKVGTMPGGFAEAGTAQWAGATKNCGKDANTSFVCYNNIETPEFNGLVYRDQSSSFGELNYKRSTALANWYSDLKVMLRTSKCDDAFLIEFQCEKRCLPENRPGEDGFKEGRYECMENCVNLQVADFWWRKNTGRAAPRSRWMLQCIPLKTTNDGEGWSAVPEGSENIPTSRRRQLLALNISGTVTYKTEHELFSLCLKDFPRDNVITNLPRKCEQLQRLFKLIKTYRQCQTRDLHDIGKHFASINVLNEIKNVEKTQNGYLGSVTSNQHLDHNIRRFFGNVLSAMVPSLPTVVKKLFKTLSGGIDENTLYILTARMSPMEICNSVLIPLSRVNNYTNGTDYKSTLDHALAGALTSTVNKTVDVATLCAFFTEIDSVRGLSFVDKSSALNEDLVTKWYGTEYLPSSSTFDKWNLQSKGGSPFDWLGYKAHTYSAVPAAYDIKAADNNNGIVEYIAYFNFSGAAGR